MTLILALTGRESIWMLADRRLSRRVPGKSTDDGRKLMFLETVDGTAILGYAGLGATARGTEPADWMNAVIRGRNLTQESSLGVIAEAMKKQLPRHMIRLPGSGLTEHHVVVPALLGDEPRLYSIDLVFAPDRKNYWFRYARHGERRPRRIGITGSGGRYLHENKKWMRPLLRVFDAHEKGKVSPLAVADHLASLNYDVHRALNDESVGERCIVAWRHSKHGRFKGGGSHQSYTGVERDVGVYPRIPTIGTGTDMGAVAGVIAEHVTKALEARKDPKSVPELDHEAINEDLARLPDKPDEDLR